MKSIVLPIILSVSALCSNSFAVQPSKKANSAALKNQNAVKEPAPVEEKQAEKFQPVFFEKGKPASDYAGNSAKKFYAWLEEFLASVPGKPDKFSSTAEKEQYSAALTEKLKSIGPIPIINSCAKKYNGDDQKYEIDLYVQSMEDYKLSGMDAEALSLKLIEIGAENFERSTYKAQNGYGAEVEVSKTEFDEYALIFRSIQGSAPRSVMGPGSQQTTSFKLPYYLQSERIRFWANVPVNVARNSDKDIACMYVFTIVPPYTVKYESTSSPSRSLPVETKRNVHAIFGTFDSVALVNKVTGEIYQEASRVGF